MSNLIILRGPSGSGKSTIATFLRDKDFADLTVAWFEADQYFQTDAGYKFNAARLGDAHGWCQRKVREAMEKGCDRVIVSNTSMARWELNPYLALGRELGYNITVIRTPGPWEAPTLHGRNVHGVPLETLEKQIAKYQPLDDEQEWHNMSIFE